MNAPHRLDVVGKLCPLPLLLTARVIADLAPGERLELIGDDPGILEDLPAWCEEAGHPLVEIGRVGKLIRCVVEKSGEVERRIPP